MGFHDGPRRLPPLFAERLRATSFSDDFNRPDGPPGNGWTTPHFNNTGPYAISGQLCVTPGPYPVGVIAAASLVRTVPFIAARVEADIARIINGNSIEVFCGTDAHQQQDASGTLYRNGISAFFQNNQVQIFELDQGNATSRVSAAIAWAAGRYGLAQDGADYVALLNGNVVVRWVNGAGLTGAPMGSVIAFQGSEGGGNIAIPTVDNVYAKARLPRNQPFPRG